MLLENKLNVNSGPGWNAEEDISVCTVIASVGSFQQTSLPPADSWWSLTCTAGGTLTSPPKVGTPLVLCLLNTHSELMLKYLARKVTVKKKTDIVYVQSS